jgi:hypothetical protein
MTHPNRQRSNRQRSRICLVIPLAVPILLAACGLDLGTGREPQVIPNRSTEAPQIAAIERLGDGLLVAGSTERFQVHLDDLDAATIRWRASGGDLEPDGRFVTWRLPDSADAWLEVVVEGGDGEEATARFDFGLTFLSNDARGALPHPNETAVVGASCDLAIDASGTPHVVYWDETHPSIWYARWDGTWHVELIEGMGFGVGGQVRRPMAITTAADGTPHIVYGIDDVLHYATPDGAGSWTIERVDGSPVLSIPNFPLAIALDPANGYRPTVTYARSSTYRGVAIAWRTGPGAWSSAGYGLQNWTTAAGGLLFDSSGTAHLTANYSAGYYLTWTEAGGFAHEIYRTATQSGYHNTRAHIALDEDGAPIILDHQGIWHRPEEDWIHSAVAAQVLAMSNFAWDGVRPHLAVEHAGRFELVTTDERGYWRYTYLGSAPGNRQIGFDLDDDGTPRICYGDNGQVWFY